MLIVTEANLLSGSSLKIGRNQQGFQSGTLDLINEGPLGPLPTSDTVVDQAQDAPLSSGDIRVDNVLCRTREKNQQ